MNRVKFHRVLRNGTVELAAVNCSRRGGLFRKLPTVPEAVVHMLKQGFTRGPYRNAH